MIMSKSDKKFIESNIANEINWLAKTVLTRNFDQPSKTHPYIPPIKNVIFNGPATIVFWCDNTKTVVKADGEDFDPEKGLAMAISKKPLGNKGDYFNVIKKWAEKYVEPEKSPLEHVAESFKRFGETITKKCPE